MRGICGVPLQSAGRPCSTSGARLQPTTADLQRRDWSFGGRCARRAKAAGCAHACWRAEAAAIAAATCSCNSRMVSGKRKGALAEMWCKLQAFLKRPPPRRHRSKNSRRKYPRTIFAGKNQFRQNLFVLSNAHGTQRSRESSEQSTRRKVEIRYYCNCGPKFPSPLLICTDAEQP